MSNADDSSRPPTPAHPPGAWPAARRAAHRLLSPLDRFLAVEASSGLLLLLAAAVALIWANCRWRDSYAGLWHLPLGLRLGPYQFERDLHFFVNDVLMVVFFFVIGLEIRREVDRGELRDVRRAALPALAALGGMVVPAVLYLAVNAGSDAARGWGIPMATDIAFALGVLGLLGRRVNPALRILLLALAVIDDLGAILVIAVFYSSGVNALGLAVSAVAIGLIIAQQKLGVRSPWAYLPVSLLLWAGAYASGVHPTLAGVILGLMTPPRAWFGPREFLEQAAEKVDAMRARAAGAGAGGNDATTDAHAVAHASADTHTEHSLLAEMSTLDQARRESISPADRLYHALHRWVAFAIMPLFALANAGVDLGNVRLGKAGAGVLAGVLLGLGLGKPLGVVGFSWVAVRLRLAALPSGVGIAELVVLGVLAGIGFTMSLFITSLAFPSGDAAEVAKLAILCASGATAVLGLLLGRLLLAAPPPPPPA